MALINFSGLASGIDSSALIEALLDQQRSARVVPYQDKIAELEDTNSAFTELSQLLEELKSTTSVFRVINGGGLGKQALSSDETVLTATASNAAQASTYSVSVSQLAKNATFSFATEDSGSPGNVNPYTSSSAAINSNIDDAEAAANRTISVTVGNGDDQEVTDVVITSSTSLSDFVNDYNSQATASQASVVNVGTSDSPDYRVLLSTNETGLQEGEIDVTVGTEITSPHLGGDGAFNLNTEDDATDAQLTIDGIQGTITRSSNTVSDLIPGLTLNLSDTGSNITVGVNVDAASTTTRVQDFVDAYNAVVEFITENDSVTRAEDGNEVTNIFSPLAKTSVDNNLLAALRSDLSGASTSGGNVNILADLGITTQRDGSLAFDAAQFEEAVSEDSTSVATILENLGESLAATDGTIQQFTRFNGLIDESVNSNSATISDYQDRIAVIEQTLARQEESLVARFARLEALIGDLNSQQTALASILPSA